MMRGDSRGEMANPGPQILRLWVAATYVPKYGRGWHSMSRCFIMIPPFTFQIQDNEHGHGRDRLHLDYLYRICRPAPRMSFKNARVHSY